MRFEIFQLNADNWRDYAFMKWSFAQKNGFAFSDYKSVYSGERTECKSIWIFLEILFQEFNCDHPKDFKGHSLSVSDIVKIDDEEYYYCDSCGFENITEVINKEKDMDDYAILERHFADCVRYWERELKTDSDTDKTPYINAIKEIPVCDPFKMQGRPLDKEIRENFIKNRFMDCFGKEWESYYTSMRTEIRNVN